jgi:hypothetical protein
MTNLRKRLKALEKKRPHDGTYSLEELCRVIWRHDKEGFRKLTDHSSCRLLIPQFEREDADRRDVLAGRPTQYDRAAKRSLKCF